MTRKPEQLEQELRSLTAWEGQSPELWRRALDQTGTTQSHRSLLFSFRGPMTWKRWLEIGAVAAIVVVLVGVMLPPMGQARKASRVLSSGGSSQNFMANYSEEPVPPPAPSFAYQLGHSSPERIAVDLSGAFSSDSEPTVMTQQDMDGDRHVIRKVTMELASSDVAATFLKARQLVSEAGGEYVEESSLTGEAERTRASLTLRVSAARLSDVLNELRAMGLVVSEQARGEDVTDQVVDLDARLRNERRVEQELLELLETRNDAPLEEILKLRAEISQVRTQIERYTAQQDRLSRLVALASILVIIRPETVGVEEEEPEEATTWMYFKDSVGSSWSEGVAFLSDTVAGIVGVLVGGIIWWTVLVLAVVLVRRHVRAMPEPVP